LDSGAPRRDWPLHPARLTIHVVEGMTRLTLAVARATLLFD